MLEVVLNATEFGMDARAAVDAPRLDQEWMPDSVTFERNAIPQATADSLRAMGHGVRMSRGRQGDAHTILYDAKTKTAYAANDRRSPESKAAKP